MKRWLAIVLFGCLGLAAVAAALVIPVYFRSVDARVVAAAGKGSASLVEEGLGLVRAGKIGPARMLAQVATNLAAPGRERLVGSLQGISEPSLRTWGCPAPDLDRIFQSEARFGHSDGRPIMTWLLPPDAREKVLAYLRASQRFGVREILRTRSLTNLVRFAPVTTATGQPWDAVTLLTALLLHGDHLARPLKDGLEGLALGALRRGEVAPLESTGLDLLTLGNHLDWGQLTEALRRCSSLETLHELAQVLRSDRAQFPVVYAAFLIAPSAGEVLRYARRFGPNGVADLQFSLGHGTKALALVVEEQKRIYHARWRDWLANYEPVFSLVTPAVDLALHQPGWTQGARYALFLIGAFFIARLASSLLPTLRGSYPRWLSANQIVFVCSFFILILAAAEPFLTQPRLTAAATGPWFALGGPENRSLAKVSPMFDLFTLISMVVFLVIQGVLYALCLSKLAAIRRQPISSQLKLKLLENEESLFDSGLYAGLAGTAGSLVLLAMGFVKPSLTAAYASTLFGIIFVAVLKIGYLRPYRRALILTSEAGSR